MAFRRRFGGRRRVFRGRRSFGRRRGRGGMFRRVLRIGSRM